MKFSLRKTDRRWWGIYLGGSSLLLRVVLGFFPSVCEMLYSRGLFVAIRWAIDHSTALLPFATIYIFFAVVVYITISTFYAIGKTLYLKCRKRLDDSWKTIWKRALVSFFGFWGWIVFLFLWLWGFNYARIPLEQQMHLDIKELDNTQLIVEAEWVLQRCSDERALIPHADTFALTAKHYQTSDLETEMRRLLVQVLDSLGYNTTGCVRGRWLYPKGTLFRFGASGIYMPFVGEGHVDAALHPALQPFTMAHELAHGYGFGDEAECNFLGYLACMASHDPAIRYSAYLMYWRYVFSELKFNDYWCYRELRSTLPRGMYNDLEAIYALIDEYPEFFPNLQDLAYELYLQTQGVKEGLQSYNKMVLFVAEWRKTMSI